MSDPILILEKVAKTFNLHLRGGTAMNVVSGVSFEAEPGECVVLGGPSGVGKSSILKMIYGNYRATRGRILVGRGEGQVEVTAASPREVLALRSSVVGYVSQFLRVIPRVQAIDIVNSAAGEKDGNERAEDMLDRLNLPRQLWSLPPATFSGGEQQRVNIARGFVAFRPLLLLDEPTASLDARNRAVVVDLIRAKKKAGVAIVGIFHDEDVRDAVADRVIDVAAFVPSRASEPAEACR